MNEANTFGGLVSDFDRPDFWWQFGALVLCLGLAKLADRLLRMQKSAVASDSPLAQGGLRRLALPLVAAALIMVARVLLRPWHPVNLLSIAIPLLISLAIIRMVFFVLRRNFPSDGLGNFERGFALLIWGVVALYILGVLPQLVRFMEEISFTVGKQTLSLWLVAQGVATLAATLLVALWLGGLVEARLALIEGLDRNLKVVFSRLTKALMVLLAVLIGLPLVGIDLTTLSVFGGALGVGLGFGLQKIASNYVSGFIILLDRSIRIGNVIAVGNDRGQVTQITTRYTVLRGVTGVEAIVPNELLISSVVKSESYTDRVRVTLPVKVAYSSDLERAMAVMVGAARTQPRVLADPPPQTLLLGFADAGVNIELAFWTHEPEAGAGLLLSEVNFAIWREFKAAGIAYA